MARKITGMLALCVLTTLGAQARAEPGNAQASSAGGIAVTAKTESNDGVVHLPKVGGSGVFTATATNKGESRTITVKAETGTYPLPVRLSFCRTNSSGACTTRQAASLKFNFFFKSAMTFKVTVQGTNNLPPMKADRAYLNFYDETGALAGGTSVALDDGSKAPAVKNLAGIYRVDFTPTGMSAYDLSGHGLMIAAPDGEGYILTQSGIVMQAPLINPRKTQFELDGRFYVVPNTAPENPKTGFLIITGDAAVGHWAAGKYELTGGKVTGFEYGTAFATFQPGLSERGSSLTRVQGSWKIRYQAGGPIVGTLKIDKSGNVVDGRVKNCGLPNGAGPTSHGTISLIDKSFNAYKIEFVREGLITDDRLCVDLSNSSGVAATFDTARANDTLRVLMNGESNGYSWILSRQ